METKHFIPPCTVCTARGIYVPQMADWRQGRASMPTSHFGLQTQATNKIDSVCPTLLGSCTLYQTLPVRPPGLPTMASSHSLLSVRAQGHHFKYHGSAANLSRRVFSCSPSFSSSTSSFIHSSILFHCIAVCDCLFILFYHLVGLAAAITSTINKT